MIHLPAERNVLAGHVIEGARNIPGFEAVAWIFGEGGSAGGCRGAVDWRQQEKIRSRVVDGSAPESHRIAVFVEPHSVVKHEAQEALLLGGSSVSGTIHPSTGFTSSIDGYGEAGFVEKVLGIVVVLDFNAVVGVQAVQLGMPQRMGTRHRSCWM